MSRSAEAHFNTSTVCLTHQLPEDQLSSLGLICRECKAQLQAKPPQGRCLSFWEEAPAACTLDGEPYRVFTLAWDDFRVRSMHPPTDISNEAERLLSELASIE